MPIDNDYRSKVLSFRKQIEDKLASGELTKDDLQNYITQSAGQNTGGIGIGAQQIQKPTIGNRILSGAKTASDLLLQQGGLTPPKTAQITEKTTEPDWLMKQQISQQIKSAEAERDFERKKALEEYKVGLKPKKEKSAKEIKAEMDIEDIERKKKLSSENVINSAQDTLDTIDEVEKGIEYFGWGKGYPGAFPTLIPGSPRAKWEANINKLLSSKILDIMSKLKEASRTGSTGFGQLSEKELKVLQESSTALKRNLSPEDAQEILSDMKVKLEKILQDKNALAQENMPEQIEVISPEGIEGTIPFEDLQEALNSGYRRK